MEHFKRKNKCKQSIALTKYIRDWETTERRSRVHVSHLPHVLESKLIMLQSHSLYAFLTSPESLSLEGVSFNQCVSNLRTKAYKLSLVASLTVHSKKKMKMLSNLKLTKQTIIRIHNRLEDIHLNRVSNV